MIKIGIILSLLAFANCVDYCKICTNHVGCNKDGEIEEKCRSKAKIVDLLGNGAKEIILGKHNEYRNQVALGELDNYEPAMKMPTLQWDDELASLAALNVKTCESYKWDQCFSTERYEYPGQNVFSWSGNIVYPKYRKKLLNEMMGSWFMEHKNANMDYVNSYKYKDGANIGPFMVMVSDKNTRIGCAMIKIKDTDLKTLNLVCNYAVTTSNDYPVYVKGPTASGCKTGTNPDYPGLCSTDEEKNIDVNDFD